MLDKSSLLCTDLLHHVCTSSMGVSEKKEGHLDVFVFLILNKIVGLYGYLKINEIIRD